MCFPNDTEAFLKAKLVAGGRKGSLATHIDYSHLFVVLKLWSDVTCSFFEPTSGKTGNVTVSYEPLSELDGARPKVHIQSVSFSVFSTCIYIYMYV